MKALIFSFLFLPMISTAFAAPTVSIYCSAPAGTSDLDPGDGATIVKIKSLEISNLADKSNMTVKMTVSGVRSIDAANRRTTPVDYVETYKVAGAKGALTELSGHPDNAFEFDAIFMQWASPEVNTAGPVPWGTFDQKVSMTFVDGNLYYENPSPMTARKIAFDCKATYRY